MVGKAVVERKEASGLGKDQNRRPLCADLHTHPIADFCALHLVCFSTYCCTMRRLFLGTHWNRRSRRRLVRSSHPKS